MFLDKTSIPKTLRETIGMLNIAIFCEIEENLGQMLVDLIVEVHVDPLFEASSFYDYYPSKEIYTLKSLHKYLRLLETPHELERISIYVAYRSSTGALEKLDPLIVEELVLEGRLIPPDQCLGFKKSEVHVSKNGSMNVYATDEVTNPIPKRKAEAPELNLKPLRAHEIFKNSKYGNVYATTDEMEIMKGVGGTWKRQEILREQEMIEKILKQ